MSDFARIYMEYFVECCHINLWQTYWTRQLKQLTIWYRSCRPELYPCQSCIKYSSDSDRQSPNWVESCQIKQSRVNWTLIDDVIAMYFSVIMTRACRLISTWGLVVTTLCSLTSANGGTGGDTGTSDLNNGRPYTTQSTEKPSVVTAGDAGGTFGRSTTQTSNTPDVVTVGVTDEIYGRSTSLTTSSIGVTSVGDTSTGDTSSELTNDASRSRFVDRY